MDQAKLRPESAVVALGRPHEPGAPLNTPLIPASSYRHDDVDNRYARHDVTATVAAFETIIGELDGGTALAFASGIAAVAAVVELLPAGSAVVVPSAAYSGTVSIFARAVRLGRLTVRAVDLADTRAVAEACAGAALVWLETVTNPLLTVADVPAISAAARAAGALLAIDATFSTPLVVRPLDLGADIVMHSATKYLAGHSDVLLGALVTRNPDLAEQLHQARTLTGAVPGTLESYLATRGLRTLALRMQRAQANAAELAALLAGHRAVTHVRFPGLTSHPQHEIAARDHAGFGAMICFEVSGGAEAAEAVCSAVRLITHATSLGGVESLIERRARHEVDAAFDTPASLLRFSVGIEHVEDLWADLDQALSAAQ